MSHSSVFRELPCRGSGARSSVGSSTADLIDQVEFERQSLDWTSLAHGSAPMDIDLDPLHRELATLFPASPSNSTKLHNLEMGMGTDEDTDHHSETPRSGPSVLRLTRGVLRKVREQDELEWANTKRRLTNDEGPSVQMTDAERTRFKNALWREECSLPDSDPREGYYPRRPILPRPPKRKAVRGRCRFPGCFVELPPMPDEGNFLEAWYNGVPPFYYEPPVEKTNDAQYRLPANVRTTTNPFQEQEWREEALPGDFFYRSRNNFVQIRNPNPRWCYGKILKYCPRLLYIKMDVGLFLMGKMPWHEGNTL